MELSTVEFYEAIKEIAQGNTTNAASNAKMVSDYAEQTKQTNYSTLKDVFLNKDDKVEILQTINRLPTTLKEFFLTKDDKVDLRRYIDSKIERQSRLIIAVIGISFTIMIVLIGFMYNAIIMLHV